MKYVIFDVDGVLLNEDRCFDVAGLVLWEWHNDDKKLGMTKRVIGMLPTESEIQRERAYYWCEDSLLEWLKSYGINNNCDMVHAYLLGLIGVLLSKDDARSKRLRKVLDTSTENISLEDWWQAVGRCHIEPQNVFAWLTYMINTGATSVETLSKNDFFAFLQNTVAALIGQACPWAALGSAFYKSHVQSFNDWYYGNEGRDFEGFLHREIPLGEPVAVKSLLQKLKAHGYVIGLGTGRCLDEVIPPFRQFDWWEEFDSLHLGTLDAVLEAQRNLPDEILDKPHPFTFEVALWGTISKNYVSYVREPERWVQPEDVYYIVGDSPADWEAVKRIPQAQMIATLTGLSGQRARTYFEEQGVPYIVTDILEITDILL